MNTKQDSTDLARRDQGGGLVAHGSEWAAMKEQAQIMIRNKFVPRALDTAEKVIAVMLAGRELGIPPMQAIRSVHIIDAKPTLAAETMMALAYQRVPGLVCSVTMEADTQGAVTGCVVTGNRPGATATTVAFRRRDAEAAGLLNKPTWKTYGPAMYRARAISAWCRVVAPDAILGCYTPEEIQSLGAEPLRPPEKNVTGEGSVIDVTPEPPADHGDPLEGVPNSPEPANGGAQPEPAPGITAKQVSRLWAIAFSRGKEIGKNENEVKSKVNALLGLNGATTISELTRGAYDEVCRALTDWGRP